MGCCNSVCEACQRRRTGGVPFCNLHGMGLNMEPYELGLVI